MANDDSARNRRDRDPGKTFARVKIPRELNDPERREEWGLPRDEHARGRYIVELNLQHTEGLPGARAALQQVCRTVAGEHARLRRVAKTYYGCQLTVAEVHRLVAEDERQSREAALAAKKGAAKQAGLDTARYAAIFRICPDF